METEFFRKSKVRKRFQKYLADMERSDAYSGLRKDFSSLLLLADRMLLACEEHPDLNGAYLKMKKSLDGFPEDVDIGISFETIGTGLEPWCRALAYLLGKSRTNEKENLYDHVLSLELLTSEELEGEEKNVSCEVKRHFYLAKKLRNPEAHGNDVPQVLKNQAEAITIITLLGCLYKHSDGLRNALRGLVVRDFSNDEPLNNLLSAKTSLWRRHQQNFKMREEWVGKLEKRLCGPSTSLPSFVFLKGAEGSGKSGMSCKLSESVSSLSGRPLGANCMQVREKAPWLPGALVFLGKCKVNIKTFTHSILEQANVMLVNPVGMPREEKGEVNTPLPIDDSIETGGYQKKSDMFAREKRMTFSDKCMSAINQALQRLLEERGEAVLIVDAIDELQSELGILNAIPEQLPIGSSSLVTGRGPVVQEFKSSRRVGDLEDLSLNNFGREDLTTFLELSDEDVEHAKFIDAVMVKTGGLVLAVNDTKSRMDRNLANRLDFSNISGVDDMCIKHTRDWRENPDEDRRLALGELLPLFVIMESCAGLSRDQIQDYLQFRGMERSWEWIMETLKPVQDQIMELGSDDQKLAIRSFANHCMSKHFSIKDLLGHLKKISEWISVSEETDGEIFRSFVLYWSSPTESFLPKDRIEEQMRDWVDCIDPEKARTIIYDFDPTGGEKLPEPMLRIMEIAIADGCSGTMALLGFCLVHYEDDKSIKKGEDYLRKAIEKGKPNAMAILGSLLLSGDVIEKNEDEGETLLKRAIDEGNELALSILGSHLCAEGGGDAVEGAEYLRRAIEHGDVWAMRVLGIALVEDWGMGKDLDEGERLLRRAAEAGDVIAIRELGLCLIAGDFPEGKDLEQGKELLMRASEEGDVYAMSNLGARMLAGDGVERDPEQGKELLMRAIGEGHVPAMVLLGSNMIVGGVEKTSEQAEDWFLRAIEERHAGAMTPLGARMLYGEVVEKDSEQGKELLMRAIEEGDVPAMTLMGMLMLDGNLVEKDPERGRELLLRAAELGNEQAQQYLKDLED